MPSVCRLFVLQVFLWHHRTGGRLLKATCRITGKEVEGLVLFVQQESGVKGTTIYGLIDGLTPGKHGFTINQYGEVTESCRATGSHYNPKNASHGVPQIEGSHLGDLGNIDATAELIAIVRMHNSVIELEGKHSIVNRSCVIYDNPDDEGQKKDDAQSKLTGNVGDPVGCGLIRQTSAQPSWFSKEMGPSPIRIFSMSALPLLSGAYMLSIHPDNTGFI